MNVSYVSLTSVLLVRHLDNIVDSILIGKILSIGLAQFISPWNQLLPHQSFDQFL